MSTEPKVHYVRSAIVGYTFCGRYVSMTLDVTRDPANVTCSQCQRELSNRDRSGGEATRG